MAPKRIQRKRTKGWRMPPGAVYVGRPTIFGNPIKPGVEIEWWENLGGPRVLTPDAEFAVDLFRLMLTSAAACPGENTDTWRRKIIEGLNHLRGKDLACWCPLGKPCHADVLLELSNQ